MNPNHKSKNIAKWRDVFSVVCLSAFLFVTATFAQPPTLRTNGKIAFASTRDGNREIYVMNNDGTNQVRLTNNPGADDFPAWSPNGRRIAYLNQSASGNYAIKLMDANGIEQAELTPVQFDGIFDPFYLPRWRMDWSPDGSKIAFTSGYDIFVINIDGSNRVNLTNSSSYDSHPSWSPDGSRIVFSSNPIPGDYDSRLYMINANGSNLTALSGGAQGNYIADIDPAWSPDGEKLAGVRSWFLDVGVFFIRTLSGTWEFLDFTVYRDSSTPDWSPDGTKIVFGAVVDPYAQYTNSEIFVINADGSGITQLTNTLDYENHPSWQPLVSARTFADFDGDGKADISIFRLSDRFWYLNRSTQGFSATQFGLSSDKITPADFDGDGKTDIAVYRDGTWYLLRSSEGFATVQFGLASDIPVPADFTGDGRAEVAVYRNGVWYTLNLANNQSNAVSFGISNDKPVVGDYDGDGRADYAIYRNGTWYLLRSQQGFAAIQFGLSSDKLVPGDYDSDGKTDIAVYRDGIWYLLRSLQGFAAVQFGTASDIPAPADYDGEGKTDVAVYRDGTWYLQQSTNGFSVQQFGRVNDKPVPSAYLP